MGKTLTTDELLITKLTPPQPRPPVVLREALLFRLDQGLDQKLTLISAPAGFGKTILVSEWVHERMKAEGGRMSKEDLHPSSFILPPLKFAWLSLDPEDNDPVRFWRYLFTACQVFDDQAVQPALRLLNVPGQPPLEAAITAFINQAAQLPGKRVIIIEDYHLITSAEVHKTLSFFLDHLPGSFHLVLTTRSDPPLPLARLRARNELHELRLADLRFTLEESLAFFQRAVPFPLSEEELSRLMERTEGWPAGLRLVTLAIQGKKDQAELDTYLATFTGSHRPILEYLIEDVFNRQTETIQEFLLQTSILPRLTASLCDAITGRRDSAQILEQIERRNLFLTPAEASAQWYRFHALFAEAMMHYARQRLGLSRLHELAQKASLWYEEHRMLEEAIEASLFAQEIQRAADLIQRFISPRLVQNEFHTLRRWMEQLPEAVLQTHPAICMTFATAILFTSDRHSPETKARLLLPVQIAEEHWKQQENEPRLGQVLAFRSLVAWLQRDFPESFLYARQALNRLPEQDKQWRAISLIMIGVEEMLQGKLNAARQTLGEALALAEASENIYGTLDSMLLVGEICYQQGELRQAEQIFNQTLTRTENAPVDPDQVAIRKGRALLGLGMLALERNDLEAAEEAVSQAVAASQQFPEEDMLADSPIILSQVKYAQGEIEQAISLLGSLLAQPNRPFLFRIPRLYQIRFALASGDLAAVERWASNEALPGDDISRIQMEQQALIVARLRIEQSKAEDMIPPLQDWLAEAQDNGRIRSELEIQILLSLAYAARGSRGLAVETLVEALNLAQPEGHRRIFLDEGERMAALLRESLPEIRQKPLAAYARTLYYTLSQEQTQKADHTLQAPEILIEPLSDQERRVLRLLAAGLSNPEIAQELFISINTVKTHIKNIYSKLGVNSRKSARQAARQLGMA
jgi:LuxR family maltose regulon positive regulatory protein